MLTADGNGGASWQDAGGGGGGGFTPRFLYGTESVSASRFDVTKNDYYFDCKVKSGAGDLVSVSFTANVNCYVIIYNDTGTPVSIGKAMNVGETLSKDLNLSSPSGLTVRVYPTAEYDSAHLTIGVLTIVED